MPHEFVVEFLIYYYSEGSSGIKGLDLGIISLRTLGLSEDTDFSRLFSHESKMSVDDRGGENARGGWCLIRILRE